MKKNVLAVFVLVFVGTNVVVMADKELKKNSSSLMISKNGEMMGSSDSDFDYPCPYCGCSTCWELYYDGGKIKGGKCTGCGLEFEILYGAKGNVTFVPKAVNQSEKEGNIHGL